MPTCLPSLCTPEADPHDGTEELLCLGFRWGLANAGHYQEVVGLEEREVGVFPLYLLPFLVPSGINTPAQ